MKSPESKENVSGVQFFEAGYQIGWQCCNRRNGIIAEISVPNMNEESKWTELKPNSVLSFVMDENTVQSIFVILLLFKYLSVQISYVTIAEIKLPNNCVSVDIPLNNLEGMFAREFPDKSLMDVSDTKVLLENDIESMDARLVKASMAIELI